MRPLGNQCTHDKHTEDGGALRDLLQQIAAEIAHDEINALAVAIDNAEVKRGKAHDVEQQEKDHRTEQAAAECKARAKCRRDRSQRPPEHRITNTTKRSHQTDLDAVDRAVRYLRAVRACLLHRRRDTENGTRTCRCYIEEVQMPLECRRLFRLVVVEALDGRNHIKAEPQRMNAFKVKRCLLEIRTHENPEQIRFGQFLFHDAPLLNLPVHHPQPMPVRLPPSAVQKSAGSAGHRRWPAPCRSHRTPQG